MTNFMLWIIENALNQMKKEQYRNDRKATPIVLVYSIDYKQV